jgi:4-diphosphocytidyl-2-C-methyl-D-erythritol kinase
MTSPSASSVHVRAPGKVNLSLRVGPVREDGYHPLVTVFQAVALSEDVRAHPVAEGSGITLTVAGPQSDAVPTDATNLAWRAADALARYAGVEPDVHLEIVKGIPVAGGMAGGSADAAATLVACDALWETGLSRDELIEIGAGLGADVPFGLVGHTAVGTGRGDLLTPAMVRGTFHWVFAVSQRGLSTAEVFRAFDAAGGGTVLDDADETHLMQALRAGDAVALGRALHNDLEPIALDLRPDLRRTMDIAREADALGVVVSGSGPTIAALARSAQHALTIEAAWMGRGGVDAVHCAVGPAPGARVLGR